MKYRVLTLDATIENIPAVTDFVNDVLESAQCPYGIMLQLDIAIDELFSNIARYAYPEKAGTATVRVGITENPKAAVLSFTDTGIPYNPLKMKNPDITLPAYSRPVGGLGIFLAKKTMDSMVYRRREGKNHLRIRKVFNAD